MARLLVAEDDDDIATLIRMLLSRGGHEVTLAPDGRDAAEHCRRGQFDLLIFDVGMPYLTGFELAEHVRREHLMVGVPLMFLTAYDAAEDVRRGRSLGASAYLTKPFVPADLVATVDRLLEEGSSPTA